ncbi:response regulator [bacterium]|nr:MAG: response regulator [bacterium]
MTADKDHQTQANEGSILIVDDNPSNLRVLSQMLSGRGYSVRPVTDGYLVQAGVRASPPDLILLDISMPDMDGFEVCRRLKADEESRDIPIIFISAMSEIEDKIKAFTAGGVDYITKPFQLDEVIARIETHISLRNLQKQLEAANHELTDYRNYLEEIVKERTKELEKANQKLQQEINDRKLIEAKMLSSQRLVDLGTLAAGITHDMKSPLQVIVGISESLKKQIENGSPDKEYIAEKLDIINRNGWRIEAVMRSLLSYVRYSGSENEPHDLNSLIKETLLLIEHQLNIWANVEVITELEEYIPVLRCDRTKISQALINLLMNARDAMPSGGKITIRTIFQKAENRVLLQVEDTGVGIPQEIQSKIFDSFFTTKPVGQGTGLGLTNVMETIQLYQGKIELSSVVNHGTTFSLYFPVKPAASKSSEK